jgi:hypothetical protein
MPARWRALKRLAIQGHDTDRELQFFSGEMRSARFAGDWPLPWLAQPFWSVDAWGHVWGSVLRFWAGLLYQIFSNLGRSLARPFAFWLTAVVFSAAFYLSQTDGVTLLRSDMRDKGLPMVPAYYRSIVDGWRRDQPCFRGVPPAKEAAQETYIGSLSDPVRYTTDAVAEAWHLAFRNAFIILDGSSDAAHRTYGCLYGVEMYAGSNPVAIVPSAVSTASAVQKLFSALMIFLFGLALRNMLKMK